MSYEEALGVTPSYRSKPSVISGGIGVIDIRVDCARGLDPNERGSKFPGFVCKQLAVSATRDGAEAVESEVKSIKVFCLSDEECSDAVARSVGADGNLPCYKYNIKM